MKTYPSNKFDTLSIHRNNFRDRADVFSRHSLTLTFQLLRPLNPSLALEIRNISAGIYIKQAENSTRENIDHFCVTLSAQKVGNVVDALTQLGEYAFKQKTATQGQLLLLKALIQEWMKLAEWIIMQADSNASTHH